MPTITTIVTVPPSVFDIHYWMFGMFVTFAITALLLGVLIAKTNLVILSDTFIITALIGMFVGSLLALFMNVLPFIVPIVIFVSLLLYMWRGRG